MYRIIRPFGLLALLSVAAAGDCQQVVPPGNLPIDPMEIPTSDPTPKPQITKLSDLSLGGLPQNIALDLQRNRGFIGVGKNVRRFNLQNRVWQPLQSPDGVFFGLDDEDDLMGQINPATGKINRILGYPQSFLVPPLNAGLPTGMDYNPITGKLYIIDIFALGRAATLFEFDPATGQRTQIGETGLEGNDGQLGTIFSLARDPGTGLLYTVDVYDDLWMIDPVTATSEHIGELSPNPTTFSNVQGLCFSPLDGKLYGLNPPGNGPVQIVTINTATGAGTLVTELPLGYTGGSLAFKPDGTMWTVNLLVPTAQVPQTDFLYQIDYSTNPATIPVQFPTLEFSLTSFGNEPLFQGIDSLTFVPLTSGDQSIPISRDVDAVAVDHNGGAMASAESGVFGFDPNFEIYPAGMGTPGLATFQSIAVHPTNNVAYVRDGLSGKVYEFVPDQEGVTNTIQYRPSTTSYFHPMQPDSGIDTLTNNLYLVGDFQMHRVNLSTGLSDEIDDGPNEDPVGVIVDSVRRRLHVNMQLDGPGGCTSIRTYNIDTMQVVGEICGSSFQVFNMAFDPARNRIAANCRIGVPSFDMNVRFFNMDTFAEESFSPLFMGTAADGTNPSDAFLTIDPDRNQLLVARPDTPPRLEWYQLPN